MGRMMHVRFHKFFACRPAFFVVHVFCRLCGSVCLFDGAWGLEILTSNSVHSKEPPHTLLVAISSLAPGCTLALAPERFSPVPGKSSGSVHSLLHINLTQEICRQILDLVMPNGPFMQKSACSTVNDDVIMRGGGDAKRGLVFLMGLFGWYVYSQSTFSCRKSK